MNGDLHIYPGQPIVRGESGRKRKGLCGPLEEVFDTAFVVVRGTTGSEDQCTQIEAKVEQWAEEWDAFGDGRPRIVNDRDVDENMMREYNLVLFGTPQTNSVLQQISDKLPIEIEDHRYTVGDQVYKGDNLGLAMCYPNPLAPSRYVAIYAGEPYGDRLPTNHKFDLLPDFIVFAADEYDYDNANLYLCAGFFDMNWQLSDRLTWRSPQPRQNPVDNAARNPL